MSVSKLYLDYLIDMIYDPDIDWQDYSLLIRTLHRTTFVWFEDTPELARDKHRAMDGLYLRTMFDDETGCDVTGYFYDLGKDCSMLELIISLARRIEDQYMWNGGEHLYGRWFMEILMNLKLDKYDNDHFDEVKVHKILRKCIDRKYKSDGNGSLFFCHFFNKTVILSLDYTKVGIGQQMDHWVNFKIGDSF